MSNPLSVLPLAMAAHGGSLDDTRATQLVSAGLTLLQRSAPLARALYGKRAALADRLPASMPQVLLDDAPRHAAVLIAGALTTIDLGSHIGLELEGYADEAAAPSTCRNCASAFAVVRRCRCGCSGSGKRPPAAHCDKGMV